jgi:hypothetical protein
LTCAPRRGDLGRYPTRRSGGLIVAPHCRVGDVLVDGRCCCCLYIRSVTDLVVVLIFVAQWCRTPVDALAVLQTQDMTTLSDLSTNRRRISNTYHGNIARSKTYRI